MRELSDELVGVVKSAEARLVQVSEAKSNKPVLAGGWSRKQVLGHLIDSASNNHQRFVRAALRGSLDFPGYDQDGFVRVQAVEKEAGRYSFPCGRFTAISLMSSLTCPSPDSGPFVALARTNL